MSSTPEPKTGGRYARPSGQGRWPRRPRRLRSRAPQLTIAQILGWADAHHARTGRWPIKTSGKVIGSLAETWFRLDSALRNGLRGLKRGSSLARLLARYRGVRNKKDLPPLTVVQILAWADAHHARTGRWPKEDSGPVTAVPGENWKAIDMALRQGLRGLPGGSSLPRVLTEQRQVPNVNVRPPLTLGQILAWADAYQAHHGRWPTTHSGAVASSAGDTWAAIDAALRSGIRGLSGGSSLAQILAQERGARHVKHLPNLSPPQILAWADAHHARTGEWPKPTSGPIPDAPGETWQAVEQALAKGRRGQPGGSSLARLLQQGRGVRNLSNLPPLTAGQILAWADAHHARTGRWPNRASGPIADAPGETWSAVDSALHAGLRGLSGGSSLARLLEQARGLRNRMRLPRLSPRKIVAWAEAHRARMGRWPTATSGPITEAPGETWAAVHTALARGTRGLPGRDTLRRLLQRRGRR
jgi:hypothetical protein